MSLRPNNHPTDSRLAVLGARLIAAAFSDYRRRFGKDLLMVGGIDKRVLAKGPAEIAAEIDRVRPLIEQGGYIPMPDHLIPPDVSWSDYVYYLKGMAQVSVALGAAMSREKQ